MLKKNLLSLHLIVTLVAISFLLTSNTIAQEKSMSGSSSLKPGDPAPLFTGKTYDGKQISLGDFKGKQNVVLYFYPKDDTPGCTKEACSFRDNLQMIIDSGTAVLGVSVDDVASHEKFRDKFDLNFPLISDSDKKIVKMYGVTRFFNMISIAKRWTFLIDKEGIIRYIWKKVNTEDHAQDVFDKITELGL